MKQAGGAALYLRLSRDDDTNDVSESIKNQEDFLTRYAAEQNISIQKIYRDDGYSGTNFNRPAFRELISDIESGLIQMVLAKDLSRLGRDYIQTGYYLERYFPEHGVRFIAVNDGVDTFGEIHDMTPVRAVFNDMYAKDISKKVRTALTTKKQLGKFIGSTAPFGYRKDPADRGHLLIEAETAETVRLIFRKFLHGGTINGIANELSAMRLPTPSQANGLSATQKYHAGVWNGAMVRRILSNPTYAGHLTQNRSRKINYKVDKKRPLPPEEWIIVRNTHEAVIPQQEFDAAQTLLQTRSYDSKSRGGASHLLTGLAFCGGCGSPMSTIRQQNRSYLVCSAWRRHGSLHLCTSHSIREDGVLNEITLRLKELSTEINLIALQEDFFKQRTKTQPDTTDILHEQLELLRQNQFQLYKDKVRGIISEENYLAFADAFKQEESAIKARLVDAEASLHNGSSAVPAALSFESLDRGTLISLVRRITVFDNHKIEIAFAFDH